MKHLLTLALLTLTACTTVPTCEEAAKLPEARKCQYVADIVVDPGKDKDYLFVGRTMLTTDQVGFVPKKPQPKPSEGPNGIEAPTGKSAQKSKK